MGTYFLDRLQHLASKHAVIKQVRGFGLMLGVELNVPGKQLVLDGIGRGLLFNCTHDNVLRFLPPYIVTEKEVDRAIGILDRLIAKA
jgi:acetylornithine/succinyldiaminopimelate/putrescine aminotransferase